MLLRVLGDDEIDSAVVAAVEHAKQFELLSFVVGRQFGLLPCEGGNFCATAACFSPSLSSFFPLFCSLIVFEFDIEFATTLLGMPTPRQHSFSINLTITVYILLKLYYPLLFLKLHSPINPKIFIYLSKLVANNYGYQKLSLRLKYGPEPKHVKSLGDGRALGRVLGRRRCCCALMISDYDLSCGRHY